MDVVKDVDAVQDPTKAVLKRLCGDTLNFRLNLLQMDTNITTDIQYINYYAIMQLGTMRYSFFSNKHA